MGLQDVGDDGKINGYDPSTTLADLVDEHNKVIVERGVGYMDSLEQADKEYRRSATGGEKNEYTKGFSEGVGAPEDSEGAEEAADEWSKVMRSKGIGVNNE